MKKTLLIDIQKWTEEPRSGIPNYTYNIVKELIRLNDAARLSGAGTFDLYFQQNGILRKPVYDAAQKSGHDMKNYLKSFLDNYPLLRDIGTAAYNSVKEYRLDSSFRKFSAKNGSGFFDSAYMPNAGYYFPPYQAANLVVTVHDIASLETGDFIEKTLKNENFLHKTEAAGYKRNLLNNIKRSNRVTAVSSFVKERLVSILGIDDKKIGIVPNGTDLVLFRHIEDKVTARKLLSEKYGIDFPFILYVGAIQPRKNIEGLIKAYISSKRLSKDFRLVLVSGESWKSRDAMDLIFKNRDKILNVSGARLDDLPLFYNTAEISVYPSFYEGFGLPVLEAFACGTPQALSNRTSIPEVGGDAAVYFDPYDTGDIRGKMENLAYNTELKKELINRGFSRVKGFTWENAAKKLINYL